MIHTVKVLFYIAFILSLAGFFAVTSSGCGGGAGGNDGSSDSSVIVFLSPTDGSTGLFSSVQAVFSTADEDVSDDSETDLITVPADDEWSSLFSLTMVDGDGINLCTSDVITYSSNTVACTPATPLTKGSQYTATVSGVTDADGSSIETAASTFTVSGTADVAGDFDADGYPEFMVGASRQDATQKVYVFSSEDAVLSNTPTLTFTGNANSAFGSRIVSNGDLNGDGIADLLVSASAYDYEEVYPTAEGAVYVYFGSLSPVSGATPDLEFAGSGDGTFGVASAAGDFNNDGFDDVIVGEYANNGFVGRTYVFYGSEEMDATADVILSGSGEEKFGTSAAAGDFNNDGYDDALIGAVTAADGAYIFYGSADGLNSSNSARPCSSCNSPEAQALGSSVAVGDLNGNGFADAIIGAPSAESNAGLIYINYGSGSGVSLTADTTLSYDDTSRLGTYVASTDVNGDGYDDVITSTSYPVEEDSTVYIFFGSASGVDSTPDVSMPGGPGSTVLSAGDFNIDGIGDVLFGMEGYNDNQGRVDVYYGSTGINSSPTPNYTMVGLETNECFGKSVAGGY